MLTGTFAAVRVVPHIVAVALALFGFTGAGAGELQPAVTASTAVASARPRPGRVSRPLGMAQGRGTRMAVSSPRANHARSPGGGPSRLPDLAGTTAGLHTQSLERIIIQWWPRRQAEGWWADGRAGGGRRGQRVRGR